MDRRSAILTVLIAVGCGSTESADRKTPIVDDPATVVANQSPAMRGVTLDVPRDAQRQAYYRATWAVIVGIDRYADAAQWPALAHAAGDAHEVHAMLRDELGFAENQIQHLTNEQATHEAIFQCIDRWLGEPDRVHADDLVLFYFAGHGKEEGSRGYLVAHDAQGDVPGKNYVVVDQLVDRLKALGCRHKCVILDSCYSGALFSANRQEPRDESEGISEARPTRRAADPLSEYLAEPVFLGLTAGRHRPVGDGNLEAGHSPFTATLLDVLRDRADVLRGIDALRGVDARWPLGVFSFSSMATRVLERVGRVAGAENQEPKWGALASTTGNGEILFRPTIERLTTSEKKTRAAYAATVREAQAALQSNIDDAEKRLLTCDEPLRGWEWRHLLSCCRMNELADERQRLAGPIAGLAWSNLHQLTACSRPGKLSVRALDTHATQTPDLRGLFDVQTMVATADAKHLAVVYGDTLALVALERGPRRTTVCSDVISKPVGPLLAIGADERLLALCSGKEGLLRIWEIDWAALKAKPLPALPKLDVAVDALALAEDGKWLVAAAGNKLHVLAAPFTTEPTTVDLDGRARIVGLRIHADQLAIVDERATVSIRDLTTGEETRVAHPVEPLPLQTVAISDDLQQVAMALANGRIAIRDTITIDNPSQTTLLPGHGARITRLTFDAHARRLASGDGSGLVKLWRTSPSATSFKYTEHDSAVNALAIGRASLIASGDSTGSVQLWRWQPETNEHRRLHSLRASGDKSLAHDGEVRAAAFSPTADLLATGGNDGALRIWNTETGALSHELGDGNQPLKCVAFSSDGQYVVAGYSDRNVRVWALASDVTTPVFTFGNGGVDAQFHTQRLQGIACFDRRSTITNHEARDFGVFSTAQGVDRLTNGPTAAEWLAWKATDGEVLLRTSSADLTSYGVENRHEKAWATAVSASTDSRWLAAAGPNRFFTVWHAPSGRLMLQAAPASDYGELYSTGIAFSGDGRRLAVATNRALRLWDWQADKHAGDDEAIVLEFVDFAAGVSTVAFSPDDQLLAVACGSEVRVFAAPASEPKIARAP